VVLLTKMSEDIQLLIPDWPAPANVRAVVSTRVGGQSQRPFDGANLGDHVGDEPQDVAANRARLAQQTGLHRWPWVKQVHGTEVLELLGDDGVGQVADGVHSRVRAVPCAVLTADCLPVLLCDRQGTQVAAVHAGWRGLAAGILGRAVACFEAPAEELLVYLGPAIGPAHFEVGQDVYQAFALLFSRLDGDWRERFRPSARSGHFYADLYGLARAALAASGVRQIYGGQFCTYAESDRFYSFRRDGATGRMVSAVWLV
jgi:YfiH family protein